MNKFFSILVVGVLAGAVLVGCSGGSETTETKPDAAAPATGESDNKAGGAVQDRTQAGGDFK